MIRKGEFQRGEWQVPPQPVLRASERCMCSSCSRLWPRPNQSSHRRGGSAHETHGRCHFRGVIGRTFRKRFLFLHLDRYIFKFSWNSSAWILLQLWSFVIPIKLYAQRQGDTQWAVGSWKQYHTRALAHGHHLMSAVSWCHVVAQLSISDASRKGWREMQSPSSDVH